MLDGLQLEKNELSLKLSHYLQEINLLKDGYTKQVKAYKDLETIHKECLHQYNDVSDKCNHLEHKKCVSEDTLKTYLKRIDEL